ncbi:isochorismatase family protein [Clostridium baratii]|uniref:isochorismatase family protein n=1 Tax=Clostridium baratii TaxID=1561 RepID=UPI00374E7420
MKSLDINFNKTALVIIDLQEGIVKMSNGEEIVNKAKKLVDKFRENDGFIAFVHVDFHDGKDMLNPDTDKEDNKVSIPSKSWANFCKELDVRNDDYTVKKRQWGAFFGTDLDLELRRRGIDTIVLCGISTNIGVESTARQAYERGYNQIFIEDAMKAGSQEAHDATIKYIFSRIGKIRSTEEFLEEA